MNMSKQTAQDRADRTEASVSAAARAAIHGADTRPVLRSMVTRLRSWALSDAGSGAPDAVPAAGFEPFGAPAAVIDIARFPEAAVAGADLFLVLDARLAIVHASDATLRFCGFHRDYLTSVNLRELLGDRQSGVVDALAGRAQSIAQPAREVVQLTHARGEVLRVELRMQYYAAAGQLPHYTVTGFNVSSWAEREERLNFELRYDLLTGLDNLASAQRGLEGALDAAGPYAALMALDLDNFQRINSSLGYEAGDRLLMETAHRLRQAADEDALVARAGNDAFLVLTRTDGPAQLTALARRLQAAMLRPFEYEGQRLHMSASIGIATFAHAPGDARRLQRNADRALHDAKQRGGNTYRFFSAGGNRAEADTIKLEAELYDAVRNGEFELYYQPIAEIATGNIVGVEALMRWQHPRRGFVAPDIFIALAEQLGLIGFLGSWALKSACMQLVRWDQSGICMPYIGVNVSAHQFRDASFVATLREALELARIDPCRIVLEITESALMHDPDAARVLLEECTALGVHVAIDDFGTGYSSLAYLQRFPLAELKIDRSFVVNLVSSHNDRAIVSAVAALARTLGLQLVAEGVETDEQRRLLGELGCAHMQGWLLDRAMSPEMLAGKLDSGRLRLAGPEGRAFQHVG
jgi:diguanylate cyclase (GGDEF)-like protein